MHFQTDRIKTKTLISFCILVLVFTGCTSAKYQQMQNERDTRREVYEETRRKEARERSRNFLSDEMIGKWEFLDIVIEERGGSEDLLKAKAALTASRLKGFRLRFWKGDDTSYYYRIENLITKAYGKYTTGRLYNESEPKSGVLRLFPIAGRQIPDLFFDFTKSVHQQVLTSDGEVLSFIGIGTRVIGLSVKASQLDLTLDLGMVLSPDGWLRRGKIRCSFQRVE